MAIQTKPWMHVVATATHRDYEGIGYYMDMGYIPAEKSGVSVSNTLEYAYDDWAIAQLAKKLHRMDVYDAFIKRSNNWKNNFDKASGFMRPKLADGTFKKDFDPLATNGQGFIEGNSWNYSFFAPQDPAALVELMGGKKEVCKQIRYAVHNAFAGFIFRRNGRHYQRRNYWWICAWKRACTPCSLFLQLDRSAV